MVAMEPQTKSPPRRWLNRTIVAIGFASLLADVGHEMATTILPTFLASLGASSAVLGLIEGVSDGLASFAKLFSGLYSDRLPRRKPLAVAGYFLTAAGMASFAWASQTWQVFAGRTVGWLGRGVRGPVRNVLLAEATTPESYGRAFGLERSMDSAGAVLGPLIALAVVVSLGLRTTFLLTLIPGLLAALLIAFVVQEKPRPRRPPVRLGGSLRALPAPFRRFLCGVGVAGLGDYANTLLILWATQAWTPRLGTVRAAATAMAFYVGYNVVYTFSCYVSGALADRFPPSRVLAGGYALAVVPAVALLWPGDSFGKFALVFGISGLYMGVWETVESASAARYVPAAVRGFGFGVLATVNGLGDVVSSILVGAVWVVSPTVAMAYVIVTSLVGAVLLLTLPTTVVPAETS